MIESFSFIIICHSSLPASKMSYETDNNKRKRLNHEFEHRKKKKEIEVSVSFRYGRQLNG
jgi:hypothetical protein